MPRKHDTGLAEFTPAELRFLRGLKSPAGIQKFLNDAPYHLAATSWSPRPARPPTFSPAANRAAFRPPPLDDGGRQRLVHRRTPLPYSAYPAAQAMDDQKSAEAR